MHASQQVSETKRKAAQVVHGLPGALYGGVKKNVEYDAAANQQAKCQHGHGTKVAQGVQGGSGRCIEEPFDGLPAFQACLPDIEGTADAHCKSVRRRCCLCRRHSPNSQMNMVRKNSKPLTICRISFQSYRYSPVLAS